MPDTALSELEAVALERYARDKFVLELGAEHGFSTITMAKVARHVVSVDWHQGYIDAHIGNRQDTALLYLQNLRDHGIRAGRDNVTPIIGKFEDVLPLFADGSFDFVFVDGGHDQDGVTFCFRQAQRLIRPGGIVATHDYGHPLCPEKAIADLMGWKPREPVVNTLAVFEHLK